jgi:site-specific recombinase XerD
VSDNVGDIVPAAGVELALEDAPAAAKNARLVAAFLAGQTSTKSRQNALDALRRVSRVIARIVGLPGELAHPDAIHWCSLEYEQAVAVRACLADMSTSGEIGPSTANLTLSYLRSLFAVAATMRLISPEQAMLSNPKILKGIRGARTTRGRALSLTEERALREATVYLKKYQAPMFETALALAIGGGLRREEIANLTVDGVGLAELSVLGKGNKQRRISVDEQMRTQLDRWLEVRAELAPLHGNLFCSPQYADRPLSGWSFWWLVRRTAHRAFGSAGACEEDCPCLDVVTGPHDFRRTFASRLLDKGFDLSEVQKLMDHESITTTALYDKRELEALHEKRRRTRLLA